MPLITQGKANIKYLLIVFLVAAIAGGIFYFAWNNFQIGKTEEAKQEQGCINSGGAISISLCCRANKPFPNTCVPGPCGCAPAFSGKIKTCNCGEGKCFDGEKCVVFQANYNSN